MLRDDDAKFIQETLNTMYLNPDSKFKYDLIMHMANNSMNVAIDVSDRGKHTVHWYNRKMPGCYDDNLEQLVYVIKNLNV